MGCGCISVPENSVTPLERWGKFQSFASPGCNFVGCCTRGGRNLNLQTIQTDLKIATRTKDNVFVTIDLAIQSAVIQDYADIQSLVKQSTQAKAKGKKKGSSSSSEDSFGEHDLEHVDLSKLTREDFFYRATYHAITPEAQLKNHAEEYFRITVNKYNMDKLFDLGLTITNECCLVLNRAINEYGYCVRKVVIKDIIPEDRVKKAMNDIVASQKEKDARITRADADKTARIKGAEADAEVSRLHGEGIAMQRQAIIAGLRKSVEDFAEATHADPNSVMSLMMMTQHTDMIKESVKDARGVNLVLSANQILPGGQANDLETQMMAAFGGGPALPGPKGPKEKSN